MNRELNEVKVRDVEVGERPNVDSHTARVRAEEQDVVPRGHQDLRYLVGRRVVCVGLCRLNSKNQMLHWFDPFL